MQLGKGWLNNYQKTPFCPPFLSCEADLERENETRELQAFVNQFSPVEHPQGVVMISKPGVAVFCFSFVQLI